MMLAQDPNLEQLVVITSSDFSGVYSNIIAKDIVERNYSHLDLLNIDGRYSSSNYLTSELRNLKQNRSVLFVSWNNYSDWESTPEWDGKYYYEGHLFRAAREEVSFGQSVGGYFIDRLSAFNSISHKFRDMIREGKLNLNSITPEASWHLNYRVIDKYKLDKKLFKGRVVYSNLPEPILAKYENEIMLLFIVLLAALIFFITKNRVHQLYARKIKHHNEELERAVEQTKAANKLRTTFLDNLNHEVRTPLNALMGFSDILTQEDVDIEERRLFAKLINENTMKLMQLFIKVNELSAIEAGAITLEVKPIDLSEFLLLASQSVDRGEVEIKVDLPNDEAIFEGDELRLLQVMHFLIENAIIHSGSDVVTIGSVKEEGRIVFYVKDRGKGIEEEHQKRIFERLYKVDTNSYGTGLGLSTAKLLVEKMGGEIWLTSNIGEGLAFYFSFNSLIRYSYHVFYILI